MNYEKLELIYEGKAKKLHSVKRHADLLILEFKNSLTAFNAQKRDEMDEKGQINLAISKILFNELQAAGIPTHKVEFLNDKEWLVKKVKIVPLEVVVRNTLAGSTAKRFGLEEGGVLFRPLVEFYLKDDELGDPLITRDQIEVLGFSDLGTLDELTQLSLKVNRLLKDVFLSIGITLVDFKLEFGRTEAGELMLADEISPDSCRLWDVDSQEKLDKDRFRRDMGGVKEAYQTVLTRLKSRGA